MNSTTPRSTPGRVALPVSLAFLLAGCSHGPVPTVTSPDGRISVAVTVHARHHAHYRVRHGGITVLEESRLGLTRADQDFAAHLDLRSISETERVEDHYVMKQGKETDISYPANRRVYHLVNDSGSPMDIIFQVSDDGVAFRFLFPDRSEEVKGITDEVTSFRFPEDSRTWIQPMSEAKTGWAQVNPSYEEYYEQDVRIDSLRAHEPGWVYPALFSTGTHWVLISETAPDRDHSGTRLQHLPGSYEFEVGFPQDPEVMPGGPLDPQSTLPWQTPWRIVVLGEDLGTIVESTRVPISPSPRSWPMTRL